jgi:hypothetical protein
MNRDDIIKMAESCGIPEYENNESQAENIIRFFHMAQAAEREKCAKNLDELSEAAKNLNAKGFVWRAIKESATAIRARGNQ